MPEAQSGTTHDGPQIAVRKRFAQPIETINHPGAHLRLDVVLSLAGVSRSQGYRLMSDKAAPVE